MDIDNLSSGGTPEVDHEFSPNSDSAGCHRSHPTPGRRAAPDAPAVCVFNNQIYLFSKANDDSNSIYFSASPSGLFWPGGLRVNAVDSTRKALAACAMCNSLYLFWKANDDSNVIWFSISIDGKSWGNGNLMPVAAGAKGGA